jgi:hypothetical protein
MVSVTITIIEDLTNTFNCTKVLRNFQVCLSARNYANIPEQGVKISITVNTIQ